MTENKIVEYNFDININSDATDQDIENKVYEFKLYLNTLLRSKECAINCTKKHNHIKFTKGSLEIYKPTQL